MDCATLLDGQALRALDFSASRSIGGQVLLESGEKYAEEKIAA